MAVAEVITFIPMNIFPFNVKDFQDNDEYLQKNRKMNINLRIQMF